MQWGCTVFVNCAVFELMETITVWLRTLYLMHIWFKENKKIYFKHPL